MKKIPKTVKPITIEDTIGLIQSTIDSWTHPMTVWLQGKSRPSIHWSFGFETPTSGNLPFESTYALTITVRYGPFGEYQQATRRQIGNYQSIDKDWVTNALFASLTFEWSPYWFDGAKWRKRMEVMG